MACIRSRLSPPASSTTAQAFPVKGRSVKASTRSSGSEGMAWGLHHVRPGRIGTVVVGSGGPSGRCFDPSARPQPLVATAGQLGPAETPADPAEVLPVGRGVHVRRVTVGPDEADASGE